MTNQAIPFNHLSLFELLPHTSLQRDWVCCCCCAIKLNSDPSTRDSSQLVHNPVVYDAICYLIFSSKYGMNLQSDIATHVLEILKLKLTDGQLIVFTSKVIQILLIKVFFYVSMTKCTSWYVTCDVSRIEPIVKLTLTSWNYF